MIEDQIFSQVTQRRAEVLREVARGKTFKEGALALGITHRGNGHADGVYRYARHPSGRGTAR